VSLEIGSRVGDYEIVSALGAGGMGKVFKVRNVISDRVEAMKVLLPDLEHDPDLADRFIREIKVQASLQHPNIAALHTALRVDNQLLMLMELVEGVTLDQRLQQGPLALRDAVDYISQVLSALAYAHEHGVIHRDIKPANMMLTPNGTVKLMDFGIAKGAADRKLTMTGTTMGSLYYMSPEQIKGMATVDARSDLYSVGVSLYELVTGKKPFDGDSQFAIMAAHLEKTPVPPITLDSRLPQLLNDAILISIGKEPEQRFQSAKAFSAALNSVKDSLGVPAAAAAAATITAPMPVPRTPEVQAPPAPAADVAPKAGRRWLWVTAGALAMALTLVALIQFGPWKNISANFWPQSKPAQDSKQVTTPAPEPAAPQVPAATQVPDQQPPAQPSTSDVQIPAAPEPSTPNTPSATKSAVRKQAAARLQRPLETRVSPSVPASAQSQRTPPPSAANEAPPQQPARVQSSAADPAVLQNLREELVQLASRAGAVKSSLANLKSAQAANGMSLRGDMTSAESRMNYMMDGAHSAINAGDAPAAKKFLDSAEREIEKLEKFLGL